MNQENRGHATLLEDIERLYRKAEDYRYHDFHGNGHETPKLQLLVELDTLAQRVKAGVYDN